MLWRKNKNEPAGRRPATDYQARQKVFSYHASRSAPEARVGRNKPRDVQLKPWSHYAKQLPIFISIAVMVLAATYSLFLTTSPRIMLLNESQSTLAHDPGEYQRHASELLKSSAMSRMKLTIDTNAIESKLKQRFPEIMTADVNLPLLGNRPVIQIETVKPAFVLTAANSNYYVTHEGYVTKTADAYQTRPSGVPTLADQSGLAIKPGDRIMTDTNTAFINEVLMQLAAKDVAVSSLALVPTPYDLWIYIKDTPYYVKFNMQGEARQQAGTYLAVRKHLAGKSKAPGSYIDVRAEDRAYYK
jgi:hypothetical protein